MRQTQPVTKVTLIPRGLETGHKSTAYWESRNCGCLAKGIWIQVRDCRLMDNCTAQPMGKVIAPSDFLLGEPWLTARYNSTCDQSYLHPNWMHIDCAEWLYLLGKSWLWLRGMARGGGNSRRRWVRGEPCVLERGLLPDDAPSSSPRSPAAGWAGWTRTAP